MLPAGTQALAEGTVTDKCRLVITVIHCLNSLLAEFLDCVPSLSRNQYLSDVFRNYLLFTQHML